MNSFFRWGFLLFGVFVIVVVGFLPALKQATGIPIIEPEKLSLNTESDPQILLDVRPNEDYLQGHIPGATSVPVGNLEGFLSGNPLQKNVTIIICDDGNLFHAGGAAAAAWHHGKVAELAGGIRGWIDRGFPVEKGEGTKIPAEVMAPPTIEMSGLQQAVTCAIGFFIKPLYMLICLFLIIALIRGTTTSLKMLFWGLVLFDSGEAFCALDYFFRPSGFILISPMDLLHSLGMVGLGVFAPWAVFRLADERLLRPEEGRQTCFLRHFCGTCLKDKQTQCGFYYLSTALLPALALLALIPVSIPLRPVHYIAKIYQTPLEYGFPILNEFVDLWIYSILAAFFFLTSAIFLWVEKDGSGRSAELPFFLGVGFSSFALFRFLLHGIFRETIFWADFWEEITELIAIGGIAWFLYIFRATLGLSGPKEVSPVTMAGPA